MNENLGINMSSYLEWNILLAVLALFGNFPYGPPLSPNGIWDSFVSLSVSLTHQQHNVVYTGNFLCNVCICKCVCGNWGSGKSLTDCDMLINIHSNRIRMQMPHITQTHTHLHMPATHTLRFGFHWGMSGTKRISRMYMWWCLLKQFVSYITQCCTGSPNDNLAKQDCEVMPGPLEVSKDNKTMQAQTRVMLHVVHFH